MCLDVMVGVVRSSPRDVFACVRMVGPVIVVFLTWVGWR